MDDKDPPLRRFTLKPKEVVPTESPSRPGDGTAISVDLIHRENRIAEEKSAGGRWGRAPVPPAPDVAPGGAAPFKPKEITPMDPPSQPGDESAISVHEMLRQNRVAADESTPELIALPPRRRSRRHRDFAVVLFAATVSIVVATVVFRHEPGMIALTWIGRGFATSILGWVLYGVMVRY